VTLDEECVARITRKPLRLLVQGGDRRGSQIRLVRLEEHPVANALRELLGAAGRRWTAPPVAASTPGAAATAGELIGLARARRRRERQRQHGGDSQGTRQEGVGRERRSWIGAPSRTRGAGHGHG
jgi:hypothetical protein